MELLPDREDRAETTVEQAALASLERDPTPPPPPTKTGKEPKFPPPPPDKN
jgi:hypothetical protein